MSKYDKMIEENQRKSKEKIELALQAIQDMLANKERISVPKLMKKTGLSRGFCITELFLCIFNRTL